MAKKKWVSFKIEKRSLDDDPCFFYFLVVFNFHGALGAEISLAMSHNDHHHHRVGHCDVTMRSGEQTTMTRDWCGDGPSVVHIFRSSCCDVTRFGCRLKMTQWHWNSFRVKSDWKMPWMSFSAAHNSIRLRYLFVLPALGCYSSSKKNPLPSFLLLSAKSQILDESHGLINLG